MWHLGPAHSVRHAFQQIFKYLLGGNHRAVYVVWAGTRGGPSGDDLLADVGPQPVGADQKRIP